MYSVNQYTGNNIFIIATGIASTTISIPYGNYSVYTRLNQLNSLLSGIVTIVYNIATNTNTYTKITLLPYSIIPQNCSKLLGL